MQRRSPGWAVRRPAWDRWVRCLAMAWRVMGSRAARSVPVAGPRAASSARMARRVGSARAAKTCSAAVSGSGRAAGPGSGAGSRGIEVGGQLAEFLGPAFGVAAERLGVHVVGELGEPGFGDGEPGALAVRGEGE